MAIKLNMDIDNPDKYIAKQITHLTAWATGRCNLRCKYCLPAGTKILMADFTWKNIEDIKEGDLIIGIEFGEDGKHIKMVITEVQGKLSRKDIVYRIVTDKGYLRITDNHAILSKHKRWLAIDPEKAEVPSGKIKIGMELKKFASSVESVLETECYMKGYLYGVYIGDGTDVQKSYVYDANEKEYLKRAGYKGSVRRVANYIRFAQKDVEILERIEKYLNRLGVYDGYWKGVHEEGMPKLVVDGKKGLELIRGIEFEWDNKEFLAGFLAGMFDAEGSVSKSVIKIFNFNNNILRQLVHALEEFGFDVAMIKDKSKGVCGVRIVGGLKEAIRFIGIVRPAVYRKVMKLKEVTPRGYATIIDIIEEREEIVYNIQTGTENYIAEGFIVHNCFVYKLYPQQPNSDMSPDVYKALIEFLWENGNNKPNIWWFGGEPMVAFETVIKPAWEYAYNKGYTDYNPYKRQGRAITWGMTTNLTLIDEESAKWMGKRKFGVLCSLDGGKESHNMNRVYADGRGSWDDAFRGLKYVRKYINKSPQIRWSFAPNNLRYLYDDIVMLVEDEKLYGIAPDPVYEVEWSKFQLLELRDIMRRIRDKMIDWMREGLPVHLKFVRDGTRVATFRGRQWKSRCGLAQTGMGVDINGDLYPCHRFVASRVFKLGNVKTGIDLNARRQLNADWIAYPPINRNLERCKHCVYRKACMGGCLAVNYDVYGNIHGMPDSYCAIMELLSEIWTPFHQLMVDENNETYLKLYVKSPAGY